MKITEITVESKLDEYGNSPNDSIDPRFAGGAPQSINNLKARRLARAAKTTTTTAPTTPTATATAPTKPTVPGQPTDTAADTGADDDAATPSIPATPGTAGKKNGKGFWSGVFRGAGQEQTAQTIDDYNSSKDTAGTAGTPEIPGQPGAKAVTKPVTPAKPNPIDGTPDVTEPTPGPAPVGKGTPAPAADATQNPLFRDPAAFKAEWDKFIKSQPENYKLITNTELLGVLKDMWKYSGGVRAESKNNKKQGLKK